MNFSVFDFVVLVTFVISLSVFFQKPTPVYLKIFPLYLLCALIVGLVESWLSDHGHYNAGVGNVWGAIEFCFYFFVLHEIIVSTKIRKIIIYTIIVFSIFAFFNIFFLQKKVGFNAVNFTVGCLITVLCCIYYLVELFQKTETPSLAKLPAFWIASAILFNTVLSFPTFAFSSFMLESGKSGEASQIIFKNLDAIILIIIVLTSLLYMIGFLCRIRIRKSTL
jgi:hypothetical protein